jgi:hypothetical protein
MFIDKDFVKSNFPPWSKYCVDENGDTQDSILESCIQLAEKKLLTYVKVDESTITDSLILDLFNIVRYNCFGLIQGDTEFKEPPQIVKDFNATIKNLEQYKSGELRIEGAPTSGVNKVTIKSKPRLFGSYFNPTGPIDPERGLY